MNNNQCSDSTKTSTSSKPSSLVTLPLSATSLAPTEKLIRSAYSPRARSGMTFTGPGRTKQSFRDETDINLIMARFQKTGLIDFVEKNAPQYADVTGLEFQACMDKITSAREMFSQLPAKWRRRFDDDPAKFLDFVNDPANEAEAIALGIVPAKATPPAAGDGKAVSGAPKAPAEGPEDPPKSKPPK